MPRFQLYIKKEDELVWHSFQKWCERENISVSDWLIRPVKDHVMVHCQGNNQTLIEFAGLPKTLPLWRTCRHSDGKLVNNQFSCRLRGHVTVLQPSWCERNNGDWVCYRPLPVGDKA